MFVFTNRYARLLIKPCMGPVEFPSAHFKNI